MRKFTYNIFMTTKKEKPKSLKELREAEGWTQAKAAMLMGMSIGTLRGIEQGRHFPAYHTRLALERMYGAASVSSALRGAK